MKGGAGVDPGAALRLIYCSGIQPGARMLASMTGSRWSFKG